MSLLSIHAFAHRLAVSFYQACFFLQWEGFISEAHNWSKGGELVIVECPAINGISLQGSENITKDRTEEEMRMGWSAVGKLSSRCSVDIEFLDL